MFFVYVICETRMYNLTILKRFEQMIPLKKGACTDLQQDLVSIAVFDWLLVIQSDIS